MRYAASEKLEIIRQVEGSHLSARQTLAKLGIPRTTFYRWYDRYRQSGETGLQDQSPKPKHVWKGSKKRFWSDEEKASICVQTRAPGVSVAQVARRYAMNANLIHKWLRDPRFIPDEEITEAETADFLPVEIEGIASPPPLPQIPASPSLCDAPLSAQRVDITLSDGRRILVEGTTTLSAVLALVEGLMP
jgi:transposase